MLRAQPSERGGERRGRAAGSARVRGLRPGGGRRRLLQPVVRPGGPGLVGGLRHRPPPGSVAPRDRRLQVPEAAAMGAGARPPGRRLARIPPAVARRFRHHRAGPGLSRPGRPPQLGSRRRAGVPGRCTGRAALGGGYRHSCQDRGHPADDWPVLGPAAGAGRRSSPRVPRGPRTSESGGRQGPGVRRRPHRGRHPAGGGPLPDGCRRCGGRRPGPHPASLARAPTVTG